MEAGKTLEELLREQLADKEAAERAKRTVGTPEAVERLKAEIEQTLTWWRNIAEEKKYVIGRLAKKPGSSEELAMLALRDERLLNISLNECGCLFSDGSLCWEDEDGVVTLLNDEQLQNQWPVVIERMADAVAAVRDPAFPTIYPGVSSSN